MEKRIRTRGGEKNSQQVLIYDIPGSPVEMCPPAMEKIA